jgi:hypothetical protein
MRLLVLACPLLCATGLLAQQPPAGSRLLETNHWAYEYLNRLRTRGYLASLDPLAQPYRWADVVRELSALSPDTLPQPVAGWVRLLRSAFVRDPRASPSGSRAGVVLQATGEGANTDRLDALRPTGQGSVWPAGTPGAWVETGPLAAEMKVSFDLYPSHDPELRVPVRPLGGLMEHSYISLSAPLGSIVLGRVARNWAPPGARGLLVSDLPLGYSQLGFEVRLGRFRAEGFTGELDTLAGSKRYLAAHRLSYVTRRFGVAAVETMLYGAPGSSGPSLELLNPLTIYAFERENPPSEDRNQNLMLGLEVWHTTGPLQLYGEGLLDDLTVSDTLGGRPPSRYAFTLGARLTPRNAWWELSGEVREVSAFAYRSNGPADRYGYLGRGLAENFADYRQVTVQVDLFPSVTGLRLSPAFRYLEQGEGDWRAPFPDLPTFLNSPALFLGVVERTARASLRGRYQPRREFWLSWDVGHNWVRDAGHVAGASATRFVVLVNAGARLEFGGQVAPGR